MITVFNRRALPMTFSMDEQARMREQLSAAGIEHRIVTRNSVNRSPLSANRARYGSAGISTEYMYQHTIYVHAADYSRACHVLGI